MYRNMKNRKINFMQCLVCAILFVQHVEGSFLDYFLPAKANLAIEKENSLDDIPNVLYELNQHEEKFLLEAQQLLKESQSKLDTCNQRVIHTLKKSCHEINAEDLGKLAIMLLNCQFAIENRKLFPCTEKMELKDCSKEMEPETWNSYQVLTNRVKATCIIIRHQHFKAATELTVNKLMSSAHDQLSVMNQLTKDQKNLQAVTNNIIDELAENSGQIIDQQKDVIRLSEDQRVKTERNIKELNKQQNLIKSGQIDVAILLSQIKQKIDDATNDLIIQTENSQNSRAEILYDLDKLQESVKEIINHLDSAIITLLNHNEIMTDQYENTLNHLEKINTTIFALVGVMKDFNVEKLLNWFNETITENEYFAKKLKVTLMHLCYLLMGMICFSFLSADPYIRLFFIIAVSLNFIGIVLDYYILNMLTLTIIILITILCYFLIKYLLKFNFKIKLTDDTVDLSLNSVSEAEANNNNNNEQSSKYYENNLNKSRTTVQTENSTVQRDVYTPRNYSFNYLRRSMTPLIELPDNRNESVDEDTNHSHNSSRSGTPSINKVHCKGITQKNQRCRLYAINGTQFCTLHTPMN